MTAISVEIPTADDMRALGERLARMVRGGDVMLLSGPLGAGKTTFAQGFGAGLGISEPIVSPTFTIARELDGRFADGRPAHLVHVDAYRLGGTAYAPGQDAVDQLLDELESLGLDEELEDTGEDTVVLMEWGEQMAAALAPERLEIAIDRPLSTAETQRGTAAASSTEPNDGFDTEPSTEPETESNDEFTVELNPEPNAESNHTTDAMLDSGTHQSHQMQQSRQARQSRQPEELTGDGVRTVTITPYGGDWESRVATTFADAHIR